MQIKAIIFYLDGLLVDSQHLQYEATRRAFSEIGHIVTKEDWHGCVHGDVDYLDWVELHQLPTTVEKIHTRKRGIYKELVKSELELKAGAEKLVHLLYDKFE